MAAEKFTVLFASVYDFVDQSTQKPVSGCKVTVMTDKPSPQPNTKGRSVLTFSSGNKNLFDKIQGAPADYMLEIQYVASGASVKPVLVDIQPVRS